MAARTGTFGAASGQMALMGLRYLNGRRLRTVLTTLAIVFGVALIFAINLILPSAQEAFKLSLGSMTGADLAVTSTSGESFAPEDVLQQVTGVEGVRAAAGVLERQFALPSLGQESLGSTSQIRLIGIDPAAAQEVRPFVMSEGRFLEAGDVGAVVLPAGLVELAPQLEAGTAFPLITAGGLKVYTVIGLLAEEGDPTAPQLYMTLADAQAAFNQPGLVNKIEVSLEAGADQDTVAKSIQAAVGDTFTLDSSNTSSTFFTAMQMGLSMMNMLGALALFLGAFLIFNTFRTVVMERRRDLAMLRAVGATRRQVTTLIMIESLIQGVVGTAIGLLLGLLLAMGGIAMMAGIWSSFLNRGAALTLQLNLPAVAIAVVLGIGTALIAGYWPARAAGKTSPLAALRPESAASARRIARWNLIVGVIVMVLALLMLVSGSRGAIGGALLFLVGMIVAAPALVMPVARLFGPLLTLLYAREGDLARSNLARQPGRAAITGSTLMIGLATIVLISALVSSFGGLITSLVEANFQSDLLVLPQSIAVYDNVLGADASLAERLRALPDVETVGTLRYAGTNSNNKSLQVLAITPEDYPKVASLEFAQGDPVEAFAALGAGRNAILSSIALATLGLNLGSEFEVQTPEGTQTYTVAGVANDMLTFKVATMFISQANLESDFHKTEDIMLMLNLRPGADSAAAITEVQSILSDYPQFSAHLTGEYRDEMIQVSTGAMGLFYVIGLLILIPAALGLLNTLTINVLERTREIGIVRAVGGSRSQVRRVVTGEALLLGIFGAAMGVLAGVALSYGFVSTMGVVGWQMPYSFPLIGIIAAVVVGVLLALFAAILPARNAAKLDIIRALQYE